nr:glycosyltransferase family 4 protein [Fredinandcohnia onubensis]
MKILLISNMFPNNIAPYYGTFVKKTYDILKNSQDFYIDKLVLYKETGKFKKAFNYIFFYFKVLLAILFKKYDIIYVHYASHNSIPILLAHYLKRNIKIITNVHGSDVVPETKIQLMFQNNVKRLLTISKKIIVPSTYFGGLIINKYNVSDTKIEVSPSGGIDFQIFYPNKNERFHRLSNKDHRYIGYVGRIDFGKGWEDLIKAFEVIKKDSDYKYLKLAIVGNGKKYDDMVLQVNSSKFKDDIILIDSLPQENLREIYNSLDLFIFPTKRQGESLGLVGLEAMACGLPVVGSRIGGLLSYIDDGKNGLLFEPANINELVSRVKEYLKSSEYDKKEYKKNAYNKAMEFNSIVVEKHFLEIFKKEMVENAPKKKNMSN